MNVRETPADALLAKAVARSPSVAELLVAPGALAQAGAVWRRVLGDRPALILADDNTWAAAGAPLVAALDAAGVAHRAHVLPGSPRIKPTRDLGDRLAALLEGEETFAALGSGVLNDLAKYAAFTRDRPYLCCATAASMDGYTSAGAPLTDQGFKKTIDCRPAAAVVADLDVIADAPPEMIGWGYGDTAGKLPAGADWIIADALGIEPIDDVAWPMVQDNLRGWLAGPEALRRGDRDRITALMAGLCMVGFAMEAHGTSRPASGADHQIAHMWEMESLVHAGERVSHGACVAVGCIASLRLHDWALRQDLTALDAGEILAAAPDLAAKRAAIAEAFPTPEVAARAEQETLAKHLTPEAHQARLADIAAAWPALKQRLARQLMPPAEMAAMLAAAGAPSEAAQIGVSPAHLRRTVLAARFVRSRYTILDLLDETGLLMPAVDALFPEA